MMTAWLVREREREKVPLWRGKGDSRRSLKSWHNNRCWLEWSYNICRLCWQKRVFFFGNSNTTRFKIKQLSTVHYQPSQVCGFLFISYIVSCSTLVKSYPWIFNQIWSFLLWSAFLFLCDLKYEDFLKCFTFILIRLLNFSFFRREPSGEYVS